jgi:hypothetical protein
VGQAVGFGRFDDGNGGIAGQAIPRGARSTDRVMHGGGAQHRARRGQQCLQGSLAAVGQRALHNMDIGTERQPHAGGHGRGDLDG